jgi:hypothetical protein
MGGRNPRSGQRAFPIGRTTLLVITVIAGIIATVHYANYGTALATAPKPPVTPSRPTSASSSHRTPPARPASHPATAGHKTAAPSPSTGKKPSPTGRQSQHPAPAAAKTHNPSPTSSGNPPPPPNPSPSPTQTPTGGRAPPHFRTLPPTAKLPTGTQCANWVRAAPSPENRPGNVTYNNTVGEPLRPGFLKIDSAPQARALYQRVNGDFTGTTEEILRWVSCKWGINENIVFAQTALESWWEQNDLGDWTTNGRLCPPGHELGSDGTPGQCPQSFGVMQDGYPHGKASWPGISTSTAMNLDTAYAVWRTCYEGYEPWLNTLPRGSEYHAGDVWGCVGRWFADRWHTAIANTYISWVQKYQAEKIWTTSAFRVN